VSVEHNIIQERVTVFGSAARVKHLNEPFIRDFAQGISKPSDNFERRGDSSR